MKEKYKSCSDPEFVLSELESLVSYNYTPAISLLGEILLYGECGIKCINI